MAPVTNSALAADQPTTFTGPDIVPGEVLKGKPYFETFYGKAQRTTMQQIADIRSEFKAGKAAKLKKLQREEERRFQEAMRCVYYGRRMYRGRNKLAEKMRQMGFDGVMPKIVSVLPTSGRPIGERGIVTLARYKKLPKAQQKRLVETVLERHVVKSVKAGRLAETEDPTELVWEGRESIEDRVMRWLMRQYYYQVNRRARRAQSKRPFIPKGARTVLQIDLIGPMSGCPGDKHAIVVIDVFTKKVWTRPVRSTASNVVAAAFFGKHSGKEYKLVTKGLVHEIFKDGVPSRKVRLSTDNGSEFTGSAQFAFGDFVSRGVEVGGKRVRFEQLFGIAGRSTNQGHVERVNQTLKAPMYAAMQAENRMLKESTFNYNDTKHSSTGMKPNEADDDRMKRAVRQSLFAAARKAGEFRAEDTLPLGALVRRKVNKGATDKKFYANFSPEVYRVSRVVVPRSVHARHRYHLQEMVQDGKTWQVIRPTRDGRIKGRVQEKRRADGTILNSSDNPIEFHYDSLLQIPVDSEPKPDENEVRLLVKWCRLCTGSEACKKRPQTFELFKKDLENKAREANKRRRSIMDPVSKEAKKLEGSKGAQEAKKNKRGKRWSVSLKGLKDPKSKLSKDLDKAIKKIGVDNKRLLALRTPLWCNKGKARQFDLDLLPVNLESVLQDPVNKADILVPFDHESGELFFNGKGGRLYKMRIVDIVWREPPQDRALDDTLSSLVGFNKSRSYVRSEFMQLDQVYAHVNEDRVKGSCTDDLDTSVTLHRGRLRPSSFKATSKVDMVYDDEYHVVLGNDAPHDNGKRPPNNNRLIRVFLDPPDRFEIDAIKQRGEFDSTRGWSDDVIDNDATYQELFDADRIAAPQNQSHFLELHPLAALRIVQVGLGLINK
jgi:transposase InsO family protein